MNESLTLLLCALALACVWRGLSDTRRAFELPFLAGLMVCAFVLPQLFGLLHAPFLPPGAFAKTVFMTALCLACTILGWHASGRPLTTLAAEFSERRLMEMATLLSVTGAFFYYRLSQIPGDMVVGVEISGAPVAYLFFARLLTYGLVIACLCYARRPSRWMLAVIVIDCLFYFDRIIVTGKRAETAELAMIFALAFWFHRGWAIPRLVLALGLVFALVGMSNMSDYRDVTRANSGVVLDELANIDILGNLEQSFEDGAGYEMLNAIILIDHTDATSRFDYGAFHWNKMIWNYVPTRIVGTEMKSALMFDTPGMPRNFTPRTGTTLTGMFDAFRSFWYLGALQFFLLAYAMRRLWNSAMRGETLGQFVYILSVIPAIHAFSHATDWVVSVWVHMLVFCAPVFAYALTGPVRRRVGAGV